MRCEFTVKCNTKVLNRHGNKCTTDSHRVWEERRKRPRLSTRAYNHCLGLLVEFKIVYCHLAFDVIMHGEEIWDLMRGCRFLELRVMSDEGQSAFR